jgi:hypothetical protein
VSSFLHPFIPTVQGEPDYQSIHTIQKLLQANARNIDTHLGGGSLGHLGILVFEAAYAIVAPTDKNCPIVWVNPISPGQEPVVIDQGTLVQLNVARHSWEEDALTFCAYNNVQQALKKQIITVFEPMYLDILNDYMVGFANITSREMI